ncbi:MAG TPA: WecB/TagA/CpsF family glycosyltransferase [Chroococcidiopsis sp.]
MTELTQSRSIESPKVLSVLGLPVHVLNDYPSWLFAQAQQRCGLHVVTLNAEMAMQAEQNGELTEIIRAADLVVPDGAGVVLYLRLLRRQQVSRCPGIELAEELLRRSAGSHGAKPLSIFFYGGAPGVCENAAQVWKSRVPGIAIAGTQHGYLSEEQQRDLEHTFRDRQPDIILVGLGVPRQETWIRDHRYLCPNAVWIGVGGSFDIWSGVKTRAPGWLRNNNLEWVYRLYQEPWRWRRMLALPHFAWKALWSR